MHELDVLIITTGHDLQDGRLVRHQHSLLRSGMRVQLHKVQSRSRFLRFFLSPLIAYRFIKKSSANCVILPDPELQLFLPPVIHRELAVISDVHEDYEKVLFDRTWINKSMVPFVKAITKVLRKVRERWSHVVVTVDRSIGFDNYLIISNRPNPIDFPQPPNTPSSSRLVYVGDIRESRGLSAMLRLAHASPEIGLDLVGPCADEESLYQQIEELDLNERVEWHGRCSYKRSWEIASHCLAGLSLLSPTPSFREAIPTKIWEYWAVGLPILATSIPGQSKLIHAAKGGVAGSHDELLEILDIWIHNPKEAKKIGSQGREYFLKTASDDEKQISEAVESAISIYKVKTQ